MNTLGDRLKKALEIRGLKQIDLVKATGAKGSSVSNWLSGKTKNLKGDNLVKAAALLKVSVDWLADGEGEMDTPPFFQSISMTDIHKLPLHVQSDLEDIIKLMLQKYVHTNEKIR